MNLSQFIPFKLYSFYDDSIYNQIFENATPSQNENLLYIYIYIYIHIFCNAIKDEIFLCMFISYFLNFKHFVCLYILVFYCISYFNKFLL